MTAPRGEQFAETRSRRWVLEAVPPRVEVVTRGKVTTPALPARGRLHLTPAGTPLVTDDPAQLEALAKELIEVAAWLRAEQFDGLAAGDDLLDSHVREARGASDGAP